MEPKQRRRQTAVPSATSKHALGRPAPDEKCDEKCVQACCVRACPRSSRLANRSWGRSASRIWRTAGKSQIVPLGLRGRLASPPMSLADSFCCRRSSLALQSTLSRWRLKLELTVNRLPQSLHSCRYVPVCLHLCSISDRLCVYALVHACPVAFSTKSHLYFCQQQQQQQQAHKATTQRSARSHHRIHSFILLIRAWCVFYCARRKGSGGCRKVSGGWRKGSGGCRKGSGGWFWMLFD